MREKCSTFERLASERRLEAESLRCEVAKVKEEAEMARESERTHTDDLIQREERILGTLMKQLSQAQNDQVHLDEYAVEVDKVKRETLGTTPCHSCRRQTTHWRRPLSRSGRYQHPSVSIAPGLMAGSMCCCLCFTGLRVA